MEESDEPDTFILEGNSLNTLGKSEPDYGAILWCVCCAHFYVNQIMVLFCGVCMCVLCTFLCEPDYGAILWCVCVCVCVVHIFM